MDPKQQITEIAFLYEQIMNVLGLNLDDDNYKDTPSRVARALVEDFTPEVFKWKVFEEKYNEMVVLQDHTAFTRCPHHFERVKLIVNVGYIPKGYTLGFSKLPRLVNFLCKGANLQEALTDKLANEINNHVLSEGVGVHIIGEHNCMQARGVKTTGRMITSAFRGCFLDDLATRSEFLSFVKEGR